MARGAASTALEKAKAATQADHLSARLWSNLAQTQEAAGQDAQHSYENATDLQPTRGLNWLNVVEGKLDKDGGGAWVEKRIYSGVRYDPNDTLIRLTRGKWKLKNKDEKGWKDIEYIAALKDKPYGKYPATPEMVDLNFARAFTMLAQRDISLDKSAAKNWIERGLKVIAEGREWESKRREMEQATQGAVDESREQTMNELETQLKELQEKLK